MAATIKQLPPSKLGTKEHWDDVYKLERQNFEEIEDEGEIWFPETLDKIVDWVMEQKGASESELTYALDIGSGNGNILFALAEAGYPQHYLVGIDYSEDAVKLSQTIAETRGLSGISFSTCDFLRDDSNSSSRPLDRDEWSLILDKGTLDAIALMDRDTDSNDSNPVQVYSTKVAQLLSSGGLFLITSCNFTEVELRTIFTAVGLTYHSSIKHRTFSFGGKTGSTYASVAFRKS